MEDNLFCAKGTDVGAGVWSCNEDAGYDGHAPEVNDTVQQVSLPPGVPGHHTRGRLGLASATELISC